MSFDREGHADSPLLSRETTFKTFSHANYFNPDSGTIRLDHSRAGAFGHCQELQRSGIGAGIGFGAKAIRFSTGQHPVQPSRPAAWFLRASRRFGLARESNKATTICSPRWNPFQSDRRPGDLRHRLLLGESFNRRRQLAAAVST